MKATLGISKFRSNLYSEHLLKVAVDYLIFCFGAIGLIT